MSKHLISWIYPRSDSGAWIKHAGMLSERWSLFDGRKIVAIGVDSTTDDPKGVMDLLPGDAEFAVLVNYPQLRETTALDMLLGRVLEDPTGQTFFCHAKGVTHDPNSMSHRWHDMMMHVGLDWPELVDRALGKFPMAGSFKWPRMHFSFCDRWVAWHYSGSFYWFRNADVLARDWSVEKFSHGAETWPCKLFNTEETACLFMDTCRDLYKLWSWTHVVEPTYQSWAAGLRSLGLSSTMSLPDPTCGWQRSSSRTKTGPTGSSMTAQERGSSRAHLDLYHHYVWRYLSR